MVSIRIYFGQFKTWGKSAARPLFQVESDGVPTTRKK